MERIIYLPKQSELEVYLKRFQTERNLKAYVEELAKSVIDYSEQIHSLFQENLFEDLEKTDNSVHVTEDDKDEE